jgi:hypothetical protein
MAYDDPRPRLMGPERTAGYRGNVRNNRGWLMSFALYVIGLVLVLGGIAWALVSAGVAATYVAIVCLIVGGVGVMMAVSRTRLKDPPN